MMASAGDEAVRGAGAEDRALKTDLAPPTMEEGALDQRAARLHHSSEWGVAAGAVMPDRPIVKTERITLPVGGAARASALQARPLRHHGVS